MIPVEITLRVKSSVKWSLIRCERARSRGTALRHEAALKRLSRREKLVSPQTSEGTSFTEITGLHETTRWHQGTRRALWTPWALAGGAFGFLVVLPNFIWQASHGFPFLELVRNGILYKNAPTSPLQFLGGVLFEANPTNAPIWLGGLAWLLLAPSARQARFAGVGGLIQLVALTFGHAKPYYAAPLLPIFLGAGGAASASVIRQRLLQQVYGGLLVASALIFVPIAVPILPVKAFITYQVRFGFRTTLTERLTRGALPQLYADQFGWYELVSGVARVYRSLPPEERERAAVFGRNYGVASAVEILSPELGLPRGLAMSGYNQYWFWGIPPGRGDPVIIISGSDENCGNGLFREQVLGEQIPKHPYSMPYKSGHFIWICRGLKEPLKAMPPSLRHFE